MFDCDGLLLNIEECWTRGEEALFAAYGRTFGPEHKRRLLRASGEPQLVIVDTDGELDGTYRLEATLSVGKGETKPTSRRPTVTGSAASSRRASRSGSPRTSRSTMTTRR